jgi:hypothetical protein
MEQFQTHLKENSYTVAIVSIALTLVLLIILLWNSNQENKLFYSNLEGMWMASNAFCNKSGIDGMMLYIGPDVGGYHKGYILMYSGDAVVVSRAIELRFSYSLPGVLFKSIFTKTATINAQADEDPITDIMPENQTIKMDLSRGCMEWTAWDSDQAEHVQYAEFYRDNISSEGANE